MESKESQVWRIPKKYWDLLKELNCEDVWKIFKNIFWDNIELNWMTKIYYGIIKIDVDNLENSAMNWKKWWRPKKEKTPGYEKKKPPVNKNDNLNVNVNVNESVNIKEEAARFIKFWNGLFKTNHLVTINFINLYITRRKNYSKIDVMKWIETYHMKNKNNLLNEDWKNTYYLTPYKFIKQDNWFISLI